MILKFPEAKKIVTQNMQWLQVAAALKNSKRAISQ